MLENLTKSEIKVLILLLEELQQEQSNAGCNDLYLEKNQDNIEIVIN